MNYSKKNKTKKNKTIKRKNPSDKYKVNIVNAFTDMLNLVKLHPWKIQSPIKQKANDELYNNLHLHTNIFLKTVLGENEKSIKKIHKQSMVLQDKNNEDIKSKIYEFRNLLKSINKQFSLKKDGILLDQRDKVLIHVNQFLYLLAFDK